ncbi:hypothetical protein [Myroides sp. C20-1]|uniref:hypothetical protein n=1 Tax=Myroides sp. C20-1 TaxID=3400534 RepID=UPI003D2F6EA5
MDSLWTHYGLTMDSPQTKYVASSPSSIPLVDYSMLYPAFLLKIGQALSFSTIFTHEVSV